MEEIKIIAVITAKEETNTEVFESIKKVVEGTRAEEGNISYVLHQDLANPYSYTIIEVWKSLEAIELHNASAHFKTFESEVGGKLENLSVTRIKEIL